MGIACLLAYVLVLIGCRAFIYNIDSKLCQKHNGPMCCDIVYKGIGVKENSLLNEYYSNLIVCKFYSLERVCEK